MVKRIGHGTDGVEIPPIYCKEWRQKARMSLQEVADKLDSTKSGIQKIESGADDFSGLTLAAYAMAVRCRPIDLFRRPDTAPHDEKYNGRQFIAATLMVLADFGKVDLGGISPDDLASAIEEALSQKQAAAQPGTQLQQARSKPQTARQESKNPFA